MIHLCHIFLSKFVYTQAIHVKINTLFNKPHDQWDFGWITLIILIIYFFFRFWYMEFSLNNFLLNLKIVSLSLAVLVSFCIFGIVWFYIFDNKSIIVLTTSLAGCLILLSGIIFVCIIIFYHSILA